MAEHHAVVLRVTCDADAILEHDACLRVDRFEGPDLDAARTAAEMEGWHRVHRYVPAELERRECWICPDCPDEHLPDDEEKA